MQIRAHTVSVDGPHVAELVDQYDGRKMHIIARCLHLHLTYERAQVCADRLVRLSPEDMQPLIMPFKRKRKARP